MLYLGVAALDGGLEAAAEAGAVGGGGGGGGAVVEVPDVELLQTQVQPEIRFRPSVSMCS